MEWIRLLNHIELIEWIDHLRNLENRLEYRREIVDHLLS